MKWVISIRRNRCLSVKASALSAGALPRRKTHPLQIKYNTILRFNKMRLFRWHVVVRRLIHEFSVGVSSHRPLFFIKYEARKLTGSGGRSRASVCRPWRRIGATVWSRYCRVGSDCKSVRAFFGCCGVGCVSGFSVVAAKIIHETG